MADVLKNVAAYQLTTGFTTIYTVPAATTFVVGMLHIVNTTASNVLVRLCIVPVAGSAIQANALLWDFTVNAGDVIEFGKGDVWDTGYTLQGLAGTATALNIKVSGIEQS